MDRGLSFRTYLWLAGCGFIAGASLSFLAYLKLGLPWWAMVVLLGSLVAVVVIALEHGLARPLERLAKVSFRIKDGLAMPPPGGVLSAQEVRRVWKAVRSWQEQYMQARHAQKASEVQLEQTRAHLRMLKQVTDSLLPDVPVEEAVPGVLRDLAAALGATDAYLVPLRRHCPVPVTGGFGQPGWGPEVRASGFAPWDDLLAQGLPVAVCLSPVAPAWHTQFQERPFWAVPLIYHGRAQGLLIAPMAGAERTWTPEEQALVQALAQVLAAALHPPRWSEERAQRRSPEAPAIEAAREAEAGEPVAAGAGKPRRQKRRRGAE